MNALRLQGIGFCLAAWAFIAASAAFLKLDERAEVTLLAVLIILFGVPHGALDTIFANRLYKVRSSAGWIAFTLAYLALVAITVLLWREAPGACLIGFLTISTLHFSGDPAQGTPLFARLLQGGAVIVLPALLHANEEGRLLGYLSGDPSASLLMNWLHAISGPWLLAIVAAAIWRSRRDWLCGVEMISIAALALFAPPLVAFALFFCGMHSARHILRTVEYSGRPSRKYLVGAAVAPMLGALLIFGIGFLWFRNLTLEARVIRVLFIGLSALTVPHMLLVERVRLNGWATSTVNAGAA
jgi:Brp/Blh family beta-carotene 15,15'-monooxygenase